MIERLDDGIERPGANDVVSLRAQARREVLPEPGWVIAPAGNDQRRAGRRGPGIHDIRLRREVRGAAGAWPPRPAGTRIDGQLLQCRQHDIAAGATGPRREGNAQVTLARDAPVPLEVLNPVLVALAHIFRTPGDLAPGLQKALLLIQDANEPLPRMQVLDGRAAALVRPDAVFYRLLEQQAPPGQVA